MLLPPSEDILTKTQIRQTRQAALMHDQLEDDNSDDIDVDYEIEAGMPSKDQRENEVSDSLGLQSKNSEYLSKENIQKISNGALSKACRKTEDPLNTSSMNIDTLDAKILMSPDNCSNAINRTDDLKDINLEEYDQFIALQKRVIELEAWKEQRVKEDNAFKDTINLTFTKVLDKLVELDQNYQVLKAQHISLQNATVANPNRLRNSQKSFIKITTSENHEIHEFPSDEEGNLSVATVNTVYQGTKYFINDEKLLRF